MVTLSPCLIWQIICFILPPNEYGCVYAWTTLASGPAIDLQKIFSDGDHFDFGGYVNKQICSIWGTENIEKRTHPKRDTVWCDLCHFSSKMSKEWPLQSMAIVIGPCWTKFCWEKLKRRILGHNWAMFLRKWARKGRYSQWRSLSGHVERSFVYKNWRVGY